MARRPGLLLILLSAVAVATISPVWATSSTTSRMQWVGGMPGGWNPIKDVAGNRDVQWLGAWAVWKHGQVTQERLQFIRVVGGEEQVVQGFMYRLVIDAVHYRKKNALYVAVVADMFGATTYELISFKPAKIM